MGLVESWRRVAQAVDDVFRHLAAVPLVDQATWAGGASRACGGRLRAAVTDPDGDVLGLLQVLRPAGVGTSRRARATCARIRIYVQ